MRPWKFLTSLRLTVVLLAFGILLVFLGTIAQVNEGLYIAQARWFRSFLVWFDFFGWQPGGVRLGLPLPGGYTIGVLLLLNLLAAHFKRFKWSTGKVGIQLTHLGVILLLLGQLLTDMLAKESYLSFREGDTRPYTEDHRDNELACLTDAAEGQDRVVVVPDALIRVGQDLTLPQLPIVVRVKEYHANSDLFSRTSLTETVNQLNTALATVEGQFSTPDALVPLAQRAAESQGRVSVWQDALAAVGETDNDDIVAAATRVQSQKEKAQKLCAELKSRFRTQMLQGFSMAPERTRSFAAERLKQNLPLDPAQFSNAATHGAGPQIAVFARPESNDGQTRNMPYAIVEVQESGQSLGAWLLSPLLDPQEISPAHGAPIRLALRFKRYYLPFSVKLVKTTHEVYPGTITAANPEGVPKNFQSRVEIQNPAKSEQREVDIYMNNPLRYEGLTFFQYQMGRDEMAGQQLGNSTLQVVRNPGWLTPYLGCFLVGAGMCWQFLYHLVGFLSKRAHANAAPPPGRPSRRSPVEAPIA